VAAVAVVGIMIGSGPARHVIAVSPIRDYSGSDSAARLGRAVTEMLAAGLASAPGVQVISTTRLNDVAGSTAVAGDSRVTIAHAASRAGATELLEGTLLRHPAGTLRLELQLVDLKTGLVRRAYVAEDKDPIALASRLIGQVAEAFAMPPPK
jgi:TolB-like protein